MCPNCKSKDTVFSGDGYRCRSCGKRYGESRRNDDISCPSYSDPIPMYSSPVYDSSSSYDSGNSSSCDCGCSCD